MGYSIEQYHGNYNIQKRTSTIQYIVVHYTGSGTSASGSARANCVYFSGGNRNASAHYFIDDEHIFEYADPSAYATWHVGDGKGKYGITNQNSIGIEVCNSGGPYTEAEISRLTWLVQHLMQKFGVPASRVVRHYDASRKRCPAYYVDNTSAWNTLHGQITAGSLEDEVTDADINKIIDGVYNKLQGAAGNLTYKNERVNGSKDVYQLLTDVHNTLNNNGHDIWAYNNTNVINRDVYGLITDIYNAVCKKDDNE